jgi:phage gp29-like protein
MSLALSARANIRRPTVETGILDASGAPIRRPRGEVAPMDVLAEVWNVHPTFDLTLEGLLSYYRQAERGQPMRQMDAFHDMIELDPDLRSKVNDRIESVAGCDWVVMQNQIQFRSYLMHQSTSVAMGYAATNMQWDLVDGAVIPTVFASPAARRFGAPRVDCANEIWLRDDKASKLIPLEEGLWSVSTYRNILGRNVYAAGLMRSAAIWSMFKRWAMRSWQVFADMFGIPLAVGYYEEGASPKSKAALEDAVRSIGQDGYAVLSALTEIVIKEVARGGDSSTLYPLILKTCEEQIAKLFTGGTLNTDVAGVGSYNAASVHESRSYSMKLYDAQMLQETFTASIGAAFVRWNGYDRAAPPRLKIKIRRDALQWAQTIEIVGQAMDLSASQMREDFNLRAPSSKDDTVRFEATQAPKPGDPARAKAKE